MRNPTKAEKKYWDRLADEVGCIVTRNMTGLVNNYVSIHHINGRTKKGCHMDVLPLSYEFHQGAFGIHTIGKKRWESIFGKQMDLKQQCDEILGL
jgi:hypothetical protein